MKYVNLYAIALIFCVVGLANVCSGQRFVGYVAAGANFAQVEGDDVHGFYKVGANAGLGLKLPLDAKQTWNVTAELLYVQKGSIKRCAAGYFDTNNYASVMFLDVDEKVPFNPNIKCNFSLDYVQIPFLVRYEELNSGCSIGLGFSWSRLVRAKEVYNGFTRTTNIRSGTFKTSDWSVIADVGIRLYKNLSLNLRYEYSLVPIRTIEMGYKRGENDVEWETHKMFNHVLTMRLCYFINEKYELNTNTNRKGETIGTKYRKIIPEL